MLFLLCQAGGHRFGIDVHDVVAVLPRVRFQSAAGKPPWLAGLFVHEGRPTPVIDVALLVSGQPCPPVWSSRIVLVTRHTAAGPRRLGLLMEHVETAQRTEQPSESRASVDGLPDWGPVVLHEGELVQFLELPRVLALPEPPSPLDAVQLTEDV
jgi:chemotaxis-related protein WspB